jgi:hypothetical protein
MTAGNDDDAILPLLEWQLRRAQTRHPYTLTVRRSPLTYDEETAYAIELTAFFPRCRFAAGCP